MKTAFTKTLLTIAFLASASVASATEVPAWLCAMNFEGVSKGVQILIGHSEFKGQGTVVCKAVSGQEVSYPVKITMKAKPLAPKISLGYQKVYGESLKLALSSGQPEDLLGTYVIAQGRAAIVGGVGVITAVRASDKNLSFDLALHVSKGLGVDLGFSKMKIELDETRSVN
jgi:hypothetical protein